MKRLSIYIAAFFIITLDIYALSPSTPFLPYLIPLFTFHTWEGQMLGKGKNLISLSVGTNHSIEIEDLYSRSQNYEIYDYSSQYLSRFILLSKNLNIPLEPDITPYISGLLQASYSYGVSDQLELGVDISTALDLFRSGSTNLNIHAKHSLTDTPTPIHGALALTYGMVLGSYKWNPIQSQYVELALPFSYVYSDNHFTAGIHITPRLRALHFQLAKEYSFTLTKSPIASKPTEKEVQELYKSETLKDTSFTSQVSTLLFTPGVSLGVHLGGDIVQGRVDCTAYYYLNHFTPTFTCSIQFRF